MRLAWRHVLPEAARAMSERCCLSRMRPTTCMKRLLGCLVPTSRSRSRWRSSRSMDGTACQSASDNPSAAMYRTAIGWRHRLRWRSK